MATLTLFFTWALLGVLIALLALAARLRPANWKRASLLVLGLGSALAGGLLGFWLFGRLFSCSTALCCAILAVCLPAASTSVRKHLPGVLSHPRTASKTNQRYP